MAPSARVPLRTCIGCRTQAPQAELARFVKHAAAGWVPDFSTRTRAPGRGVYLCSQACAIRALKNKRYPGLGGVASESERWPPPTPRALP